MSEAGKKRKINSDFVKDDSNLIKDAHDDAQQEKGGKGKGSTFLSRKMIIDRAIDAMYMKKLEEDFFNIMKQNFSEIFYEYERNKVDEYINMNFVDLNEHKQMK